MRRRGRHHPASKEPGPPWSVSARARQELSNPPSSRGLRPYGGECAVRRAGAGGHMTMLDSEGELGGAPFSLRRGRPRLSTVFAAGSACDCGWSPGPSGRTKSCSTPTGRTTQRFTAGTVLSWSGSLCRQMVAGHGPTIAPRRGRSGVRPGRQPAAMGIEAYAGVPLRLGDGTVFGSLRGFDPEPQSDALRAARPALELAGRLLATVLDLKLGRDQVSVGGRGPSSTPPATS